MLYSYKPVVIPCTTRHHHPTTPVPQVMMLSHAICHLNPLHSWSSMNDPLTTLYHLLSFTIPQFIKTVLVITLSIAAVLLAFQTSSNKSDTPWMLRNFLSSLSSSPSVKMPLKAPPKPTVPAAIKSAESATPGEGGESTMRESLHRQTLTT